MPLHISWSGLRSAVVPPVALDRQTSPFGYVVEMSAWIRASVLKESSANAGAETTPGLERLHSTYMVVVEAPLSRH